MTRLVLTSLPREHLTGKQSKLNLTQTENKFFPFFSSFASPIILLQTTPFMHKMFSPQNDYGRTRKEDKTDTEQQQLQPDGRKSELLRVEDPRSVGPPCCKDLRCGLFWLDSDAYSGRHCLCDNRGFESFKQNSKG